MVFVNVKLLTKEEIVKILLVMVMVLKQLMVFVSVKKNSLDKIVSLKFVLVMENSLKENVFVKMDTEEKIAKMQDV